MLQYFHLFLDIALLRRNPQDLPASRALLVLASIAAVISSVPLGAVRHGLGESLLLGALDVVVLAAFVDVLLLLTRHPNRFNQAFTALCGAGTLLNLIAWPLLRLVEPGAGADWRALAGLGLLGVILWGVLVTAHVFRHAVGRSLGYGAALAVAYTTCSWLAAWLIFPSG